MDFQFEKEVSENSPIDWWNENRRYLNQAIRLFNDWQLDGCPTDKIPGLKIYLKYARQMSSYEDCGSTVNDYQETFDRMVDFVNKVETEGA